MGGADASLVLVPGSRAPVEPVFADAFGVKLPGWRGDTVERAAKSLAKYISDRKSVAKDLFDDDEMLFLQIALKRMPMETGSNKPIRLPLPHPIFTAETTEVCLIVKDVKGEGHKAAKRRVALMDKHGGVAKVVGLSKLKTKYESFEAKRALCKAYDLFLADERVIPSLPKLIGKEFFVRKKQPVPVNLAKLDWAHQVNRARAATYMWRSNGTSVNIRIARSSFPAAEVAANVNAALVAAVAKIPKGWANINGVYLKSADSVALPLFQCLPTPVTRIDGPAGAAAAEPKAPKAAGGKKGAKPAAAAAPAKKAAAAPRPQKAAAAGQLKPVKKIAKAARA